jgi:hypothetical protein
MIMNTEQEITRKEVVVAYFKVILRNLPVWTDGSIKKPKSEQPASGPRFEMGASGTQV